jgi:hypothetical protein
MCGRLRVGKKKRHVKADEKPVLATAETVKALAFGDAEEDQRFEKRRRRHPSRSDHARHAPLPAPHGVEAIEGSAPLPVFRLAAALTSARSDA